MLKYSLKFIEFGNYDLLFLVTYQMQWLLKIFTKISCDPKKDGLASVAVETHIGSHIREQKVCYTEDRGFWDKKHQEGNIASRQP